ncbi:hypothetical protein [Streptomyces sp. P9-A4]|uniref:hypothetical protein n=1 Tax=Streptomyces sp. P9-A4 TaxID=3072285 RepID=UPI003FCCF81F
MAREAWMTGGRFGEVKGYDGELLDAPEVPPTQLKARGSALTLRPVVFGRHADPGPVGWVA